ncbi:hypothetical protein Cgig2_000298 [Carnegiea gigantea]|uniref:Uncharacterized protein n=1 Tax=Carnegiea gigantea TaxID=171969 RepID=A0A9Q1K3B2_9CARY|nr:hypothetical protein Cgig2_000298 [Carnegiea gigantea]
MWARLVDYFFSENFQDIVIDIVKQKMGGSEVVFSEAIQLAETFAYHKLMGPKSSERVREVGSGVNSNQVNAKRGTEPSNSSIVSPLLKEVQSLRQESDDVKENQRNNTSLDGEPIRDTFTTMPTLAKNNEVYNKNTGQIKNTTVLRDKGGAAHSSRRSHVLNQSCDENTPMGKNTNTSSCSNQLNIARWLNFDQREQVKC